MNYYWFQLILAYSFISCQSQVCKLQNNFQNLLQINQKETYLLYLQDYFVGDGLTYSLNDEKEYFQINPPEDQGGILGEPLSLIPQPKKVAQQKEFLLLLKVNDGDEETYEIHRLKHFSKKKKFQISVFIVRFNAYRCINMNQFDQYFIITCLDYAQQQINYLTFDSDYHLVKTFIVQTDYATKESKIISKSAGKYLCTLISNGEYQENEYVPQQSNLIIFQLKKTNNVEDSEITINLVQLQQIQIKIDFITGFEIVKEGYLFISYFNKGVEIHKLDNQKYYQIDISLKKGILGISAQKISYGFYEYNIVCWNDQKLSNFLYDPSKKKIISREKIINTTQINLQVSFDTNVFINDKYIVVSNINGISIYPTIINNVNEGRLLYYQPSKSKLSYFINIIDYLISIEEQSLILYMINDPLIKIRNLYIQQTSQFFYMKAISNQFNKPQVQCPTIKLQFEVQDYNKSSEIYYNYPFEITKLNYLKGIISDDQNPLNIKIKINCDKKQQHKIKQKQIIIRNDLQIQPFSLQDKQITFDKLKSVFQTNNKQYYLSDVAYLKQQQLYQYSDINTFQEQYYILSQLYFSVQLFECVVEVWNSCKIMHTFPIDISNRIKQFIFNIHDDYVYFGFSQYFQQNGQNNFQIYIIYYSNVIIYRYKKNEKDAIIKKYQISNFQHNIYQLEILDDRIYMLYFYNNQEYIFTIQISEITETLDILQLSHKVKNCRKFAFNKEYYGYFLYYITYEADLMKNYLNVIDIEDGKFELINKIIIKAYQQSTTYEISDLSLTIDGVYISIRKYFSTYYITRGDFFKLAFTQSPDKNYQNFVDNQIKLPLFKYMEFRDLQSLYFSSEKFYYHYLYDNGGQSQITIYNMRSTILNCIHYIFTDFLVNFNQRAFSLLNEDIFSLNKFENGAWMLQGQQIQFIKHDYYITINCNNQQNNNQKLVKIPIIFYFDEYYNDNEQYPLINIIIDFDNKEEEDDQENQIESTQKNFLIRFD